MLQSPLLTTPTSKSIAVEGISATILEQNADNYEILLEVNSNKMMIAMQGAFDAIEQFEIIAVRAHHSFYSNNQKTSSTSPL